MISYTGSFHVKIGRDCPFCFLKVNFQKKISPAEYIHFCGAYFQIGAFCRTRTGDLLITNELLYQLS